MKTQHNSPGRALAQYGEYMGLGLEFAGSLLVFILIGRYLDGRYGCEPWLTLAGCVMGFVAGFYNLFKTLSKLSDRKRSKDKGEG